MLACVIKLFCFSFLSSFIPSYPVFFSFSAASDAASPSLFSLRLPFLLLKCGVRVYICTYEVALYINYYMQSSRSNIRIFLILADFSQKSNNKRAFYTMKEKRNGNNFFQLKNITLVSTLPHILC